MSHGPHDDPGGYCAACPDNAAPSHRQGGRLVTLGTDLITAERQRQIDEEGYDADHDRAVGSDELAIAGSVYACPGKFRRTDDGLAIIDWPWGFAAWKPATRRRELVKAGALIAAAIDALEDES